MRIFLKIFVGFWLALAGVAIASVGVTLALGDSTLVARWRGLSTQALGIYAQTAADTYEQGGTAALDHYLERVDTASNLRTYLFDDRRELSSAEAPPLARRAAAEWRQGDGILFLLRPMRAWSSQPCTGPSGRRYILVCDVSRLLPPVSAPGLRVLAVFAVASLVCMWLARNVADPIILLRRATSDLADGRFSTRVEPSVARRGDEIGELGRDFDAMAARLELAVNAQSRLLADISHELRSPLARLNVAAGLAVRSADPVTLKSIERIEREADRLNTLIGQLSLLSRMESNVVVPRLVKLDLSEIVRDVVADAQFEASAMSKSVQLTEESDAQLTVIGDEDLLRRAIENVIRNAVHYTPEDSAVEVTTANLHDAGESYVTVTVRDHGPGIPLAHIGEVFRPFYRVDDARDRQAGGVGLGLAIVEHSVRLHRGAVTASNSDGGGLIIRIQLPA